MKLVPFRSREDECQPKLIEALEEILKEAKEGKIHRLVVIGVDDHTGFTTRVYHRAVNTAMIGALHCMTSKLEQDWNAP